MAGSAWLTHRDMNATSSQPRARRSRRWLKGLNAPSPARCRSRAWTARNPARASRSASVKGLQSALAQAGDKRGAEPAALPGIDHGYRASAVPGWSGGRAPRSVRPFSQRRAVLVPSTRTGAGECGITPADSTRLWRHSQYRFLHSWPAGWTGR
jgi:hypothetical protein